MSTNNSTAVNGSNGTHAVNRLPESQPASLWDTLVAAGAHLEDGAKDSVKADGVNFTLPFVTATGSPDEVLEALADCSNPVKGKRSIKLANDDRISQSREHKADVLAVVLCERWTRAGIVSK